MKELLEYLAKHILPHPEAVQVLQKETDDGGVHLTLVTHPDDTGLAIGKNGKTAHALRELIKTKAMLANKRVYLDIRSQDELEAETNPAS